MEDGCLCAVNEEPTKPKRCAHSSATTHKHTADRCLCAENEEPTTPKKCNEKKAIPSERADDDHTTATFTVEPNVEAKDWQTDSTSSTPFVDGSLTSLLSVNADSSAVIGHRHNKAQRPHSNGDYEGEKEYSWRLKATITTDNNTNKWSVYGESGIWHQTAEEADCACVDTLHNKAEMPRPSANQQTSIKVQYEVISRRRRLHLQPGSSQRYPVPTSPSYSTRMKSFPIRIRPEEAESAEAAAKIDGSTTAHYYKGVRTQPQMEQLLTKKTEFAIYHMLPSEQTATTICPLYVAYRTSMGEFRQYPIQMTSSDIDHSTQYYIDCSIYKEAPRCAMSVNDLLSRCNLWGYVYQEGGNSHTTVDTFPWWKDDLKQQPKNNN